MSNLQEYPNIGNVLAEILEQLGINSIGDIKALGSEQCFVKLKTLDPTACINKLYAIEGAIQGIRWHLLEKGRKNELLVFFRMLEKSISNKKNEELLYGKDC